ncbi:PBPRA1643 family SWIM/SEC-C metal-binding motif protein [Aliagarivorans taiwanensis]|uniref:PBPRA1643 family SWIM/SEC-C metal-binding motif protein n=1 Tax=Aliagarivorans taiwanensis TaxID=561966 RepID=UPI0003FDE254|nr:PBPRA1643 family SWIM/SEC-C metal-binding motif protein [Aliagarivorans taiwanensis]
MSKMFYKGRIETRKSYVGTGYNVNREVKAGTAEAPLTVRVASEQRKAELAQLAAEHELMVNIEVDANQPEYTVELDTVISQPQTVTLEKTPGRNDPCSCGSGKKYKKCCG